MAKLTPSFMETLDYGQQGWTEIINHNLKIINDWFVRLTELEQNGGLTGAQAFPADVDYEHPAMDGALLIFNKDSRKWEAFTEGKTAELMWVDYLKHIYRHGLLTSVPEQVPADELEDWMPKTDTGAKNNLETRG